MSVKKMKKEKEIKKKKKNGAEESERLRKQASVQLKLTLFAFAIIVVSCAITVGVYFVLLLIFARAGLEELVALYPLVVAMILLGTCGLVATLLFAWLSRVYLRPMQQLIDATKEVKRGNFEVRVHHKEKRPVTEVQELVENFNQMVQELGGIEMFRNDFINNFSHEFKTPIVSIRGFAKELQIDGVSEAQKLEYARIIEDESDRLARLSANVLELSKLENQRIVSNRTGFDLDEQIRQTILLFEKEWSEKNLEIIPDLVECRVVFDEEMLALVWNNLISNAIKFTPDGGTISVRMTCGERMVTVEVEDNGIGMTEEVRQHVFEKFFQGDPSRARKGYGVGLAIVSRVVQLCHGSVEVESEKDGGSLFRVTLPVLQ